MRHALLATVLGSASLAFALDGEIGIHDPSTVVLSNGKYYTYGTGGTGLVSDDGWTWRRGTALPRRGLAPDVIHLGDRYYVYVAANSGPTKAEINLISNKTLDPNSPDYKWEEGGVVASSDGVEDSNAIDPGVFLDPTDGRLWLTYGSYFGYIRLVELDPTTGQRLHPKEAPRNIAINGEASDMIYHDGWYYLLVTHGSCCRGADSGYNIRVGRSKNVAGPFVDNMGVDMLQGGGKLFVGSAGRVIGPGHFGLLDLGQGVQKFSLHYEADLDRGGASVLDIRPLQWKDGWPVAGDNMKEGTYQIESVRTGTVIEMAVEGVPVGGRQAGRGGGRGAFAGQGGAIPSQDAAQVSSKWPAGSRRSPHGELYAPGPAEVDYRSGAERRRLPWLSLFQGHDCGHGSGSCGDRGSGTRGPANFHRSSRTTVAHGSTRRWELAHHAQVGAGCERRAGPIRRRKQFRDAGQVRPCERKTAMAGEGAVAMGLRL